MLLKLINQFLITFIITLRPLLGPAACKFHVSCTQYAVNQLREKNTFLAIWAISKRLLLCNPFTTPR